MTSQEMTVLVDNLESWTAKLQDAQRLMTAASSERAAAEIYIRRALKQADIDSFTLGDGRTVSLDKQNDIIISEPNVEETNHGE